MEKRSLKYKKIFLVVGVVVFVSVALVLGAYFYNRSKPTETETTNTLIADGPCSSKKQGSILAESVSPFLPSNYKNSKEENIERAKNLVDLETRITKLDNYSRDANCLHILTMIYIDRSDAQQAEAYLSFLEEGLKVVNPDSYILDENVNYKSLEQMRSSIETLKSNQEQGIGSNPPENYISEGETTE